VKKSHQSQYQATLRSLKKSFELNHKQAQTAYRNIRERLERSPRARDIKAHPRIAAQEAKRAPAIERAARAVKTRAENKARAAAAAVPPVKAPRPEAGAGAGAAAPPVVAREWMYPPERFAAIDAEWEELAYEGWIDDPEESS